MDALERTCSLSIRTTSHRPHGRSVFDGRPTSCGHSRGVALESGGDGRPGTSQPGNHGAEHLALTIRDPQSTGFACPSGREARRSAFTETLTNKVGVSWILTATPNMNHSHHSSTCLGEGVTATSSG